MKADQTHSPDDDLSPEPTEERPRPTSAVEPDTAQVVTVNEDQQTDVVATVVGGGLPFDEPTAVTDDIPRELLGGFGAYDSDEEPGWRQLDPRAVTLWRLQGAFRLAVIGLPFATAVGVASGVALGRPIGMVLGGLLALFNAFMALFWPSLEYGAFRYAVRERDLLVQSGVLFRRWSSIPHHRIQHVDTRQGPLERSLGLARLLVFTAAGMAADGSLPALEADEAERLRDTLSRRGGDDGV